MEPFTFTNFDELVVAAKKVESSLEQKHVGRIKKNEMKDQLQACCPQDKVNLKISKENRNNTCFLCGQEVFVERVGCLLDNFELVDGELSHFLAFLFLVVDVPFALCAVLGERNGGLEGVADLSAGGQFW